jgi:hypothetical protein
MPKLKTWANVGPLAAAGAFALGTSAAFRGGRALRAGDVTTTGPSGAVWFFLLAAIASGSYVPATSSPSLWT